MAKDTRHELIPEIYVTEASDIGFNHGERLDTSVFKQLDRVWHKNGYSAQEVRNKIGKNNSWAVCNSWTDADNKQFCFEVMVNAKTSEVRTVSFKNVCKDYGWKSFKLSDDGQMVFPAK